MDAALIVFDVGLKSSFLRAVSDERSRAMSAHMHTSGIPEPQARKSWIKTVNHKAGDIPPVKILGNLLTTCMGILIACMLL